MMGAKVKQNNHISRLIFYLLCLAFLPAYFVTETEIKLKLTKY